MVVLFFRDEEGVVKCLDVPVDQVHDLVGMMEAEGCVPTTAQLTAMKKQQLRELLSGLGLRMTNFDRATKATIAENIVNNWSRLQTRASADVASSSAPSTGQDYNVAENEEDDDTNTDNEESEPEGKTRLSLMEQIMNHHSLTSPASVDTLAFLKKCSTQTLHVIFNDFISHEEDDNGNTGISISESKTPSVRETFGGIQAFHVVGFENGMPVMEKYDMNNKDKDDDDISISDLFDDDVPLVIDESYLKDPVDFIEEADKNPATLTIKEPKGGCLLLTINLSHRHFTFDELKCLIAHVISKRPNYDKNKGITKDSFCLLIDGTKHTGTDVLAEVIDDRVPVIEMTLMLTLKGGGKKMPSVQKAKKVKDLKIKMDEQKALTSKSSSDMSKASGIIDLFVSNTEKNPIDAMKGFLGGNTIANLEAIEEKLGTLNAGGADVKIRSIASCFFGDVFVKMEAEKDEREKMLLLAKSSLEWAWNMAGENDTSLNLMKFRDMIEKAKIFKQGQMTSISQPVAVATPMED